MSEETIEAKQAQGQESEQALLELALKELDTQNENFEHLDAKTGVILGFALVSLAQLSNILLRLPTKIHLEGVPLWAIQMIFLVTIAAVLSAAVCGLLALLPRQFWSVSVADDLRVPAKETFLLYTDVFGLLREVLADNDRIYSGKCKLTTATVLSVGAAILGFAVLGAMAFFSFVI